MTIRVEGVSEVRRALRKMDGGAQDLKEAHAEGAAVVAAEARALVPYRTGVLAGSIRSSGQARAGVVRAGRASVPYAGPIHFGWAKHGISPQPFLYEAADRRADEVRDRYLRGLRSLARDSGLSMT